MTTAEPKVADTGTHRTARVVSEVLSPVVVLPACTFIVSAHASQNWLAGLAHGAVAVFFAVGFPYGVLLFWVRSGRLADREIRERAQRPAIMLITLASVSLGMAVLWLLQVPRDLFVHMAAMLAGLATTLAVTTRWKISIHTACLAGAVVSVSALVTPWALGLTPLLSPLAWSRVLLKHHTLAQVGVGCVLGAAVAAAIILFPR